MHNDSPTPVAEAPTNARPPARRTWLLAGAGALAASAGLGWQVWRQGVKPAGAAAPVALDAATTAFWQSKFTQPDDSLLVMASLRGAPLVLNFWGTWCPPCVQEMPELDRFARHLKSRGGHVVGLAVDNPTAVRTFLTRLPVSYAIGMAGFDGSDLARSLGNGTGALPFTAVFDRQGAVVQRKLGVTSYDELQRWTQML